MNPHTVQALFHAVRQGDLAKLRQVLARDGRAYLNFADELGWTPLLHAVRQGSPELVQVLLEGGAFAAVSNRQLREHLRAVMNGRVMPRVAPLPCYLPAAVLSAEPSAIRVQQILKLLLGAGAPVDQADHRSNGRTALMEAVLGRSSSLVAFLLQNRASPIQRVTPSSESVLALAINNPHILPLLLQEATRITDADLCRHKPNKKSKLPEHQSLVHLAAAVGAPAQVLELLVDEYLLPFDEPSPSSPLQLALRGNHRHVAELLMARGASSGAPAPDQEESAHVAAQGIDDEKAPAAADADLQLLAQQLQRRRRHYGQVVQVVARECSMPEPLAVMILEYDARLANQRLPQLFI